MSVIDDDVLLFYLFFLHAQCTQTEQRQDSTATANQFTVKEKWGVFKNKISKITHNRYQHTNKSRGVYKKENVKVKNFVEFFYSVICFINTSCLFSFFFHGFFILNGN